MTYLIIPPTGGPFYTEYYSYDNCYCPGMIVIDLQSNKWSDDGINWQEIQVDHL